jgi:hypothetical protein
MVFCLSVSRPVKPFSPTDRPVECCHLTTAIRSITPSRAITMLWRHVEVIRSFAPPSFANDSGPDCLSLCPLANKNGSPTDHRRIISPSFLWICVGSQWVVTSFERSHRLQFEGLQHFPRGLVVKDVQLQARVTHIGLRSYMWQLKQQDDKLEHIRVALLQHKYSWYGATLDLQRNYD